ncbi:protein HOTHEAD-like [Cryptomeria japonica]|uniref:protein HOTHEAD-like n=1 Tax=Cryptomeria japonica TaxID=3369 RepID=UPI0027DA4DE1|nr:protein HOTHEAD-like [Cryptomeria japonica]
MRMGILFFLISCLLLLTNHHHLFCPVEATQNLEYPYSFMTADAEKAAARKYDYIIAGGGTAGCPLAATLSQNYSVLVLERGGSPYGNPVTADNKDFFKVFGNASDYPYELEGFVTEDGVQTTRGRVLGGGTSVNAGFYSRASLQYIRSAVRDGLLEAGVLPYHGYTLDNLAGTKISATIFDKKGSRHTAADLLHYANPDNIVVLLNATASRILFDSSTGKLKASGVDFISSTDGKSYQVSANKSSDLSEVILSAGPIGSPQLLLLSGIGPSDELEKLNITVHLDLKSVGKGVQDPPRSTVVIESPKPLEFGNIQVVGIIDKSNIYIEPTSYFREINATHKQYLGAIFSKVAYPLSRGELWLRSKDPLDTPYVRYNYFSNPLDLQECMVGVKTLSHISMTSSIQEYAFNVSGNTKMLRFSGSALPENPSDNDALAKFCKDTLASIWHYHGGCQVDLVIDQRYCVKGIDNLRIVDNSIYKDSPGTNPQATTMMLGRYTGLRILQEHMQN